MKFPLSRGVIGLVGGMIGIITFCAVWPIQPKQTVVKPISQPAEVPVQLCLPDCYHSQSAIGPITFPSEYWPSQSWFTGIMELETGGDPEARKENPFQILEPFWNEGCEELKADWDYLQNRHDIETCQFVIGAYFLKYGVKDNQTAAMVFRRGLTGSGWKYWKALKNKLDEYHRIEMENE